MVEETKKEIPTPVVGKNFLEKQNELFEKTVKLIQETSRTFNKGDNEYAVFFAKNLESMESFPLLADGTFVTSNNFNLIYLQDPRFINIRSWVNKSVWHDPTTYFALPEGKDWTQFLNDVAVNPNANVFEKTEARLDALKKEVAKTK